VSSEESRLDRHLEGKAASLRAREPGRMRKVHPYSWLWEPLEQDATFVLAAMFGSRVAYLDGKLVLCFSAREEPWRGLLVGTERAHHASLVAQFPSLTPHPILPKWLYLAESADDFERTAERLVALAGERDPRIGVAPKAKGPKSARRARNVPHETRQDPV
jgi:hypothetical protein